MSVAERERSGSALRQFAIDALELEHVSVSIDDGRAVCTISEHTGENVLDGTPVAELANDPELNVSVVACQYSPEDGALRMEVA